MMVQVLPAYAGMIPFRHFPSPTTPGAPRVCGDDPSSFGRLVVGDECSPRMRG